MQDSLNLTNLNYYRLYYYHSMEEACCQIEIAYVWARSCLVLGVLKVSFFFWALVEDLDRFTRRGHLVCFLGLIGYQ